MKQSTVSPRIDAVTERFLEENFRSKGGGAEYALEAFRTSHRWALAEIQGIFTAGELAMVLDISNGVLLTAGICGQHIGAGVSDSFALYPGMYERNHGVEKGPMLNKIRKLTHFQRVALEIWASAFWKTEQDLDEYVKPLAKEEG